MKSFFRVLVVLLLVVATIFCVMHYQLRLSTNFRRNQDGLPVFITTKNNGDFGQKSRSKGIESCHLYPAWGSKESSSTAAYDSYCASPWWVTLLPQWFPLRPNMAHPFTTATKLTCPASRRDFVPLISPPNRTLTIFHIYYASPAMLLRQLEHYSKVFEAMPSLKSQIQLLIVDDGSPDGLRASEYITKVHYQQIPFLNVAQIDRNIPWNQPGARNLAMYLLQDLNKDCLVVSLDLDLLLPLDALKAVLTWPVSSEESVPLAHAFNRVSKYNVTYKVHPSAMAIAPQDWWSGSGGMDEAFVGNYGWEDLAFWFKWKMGHERVIHNEAILQQFGIDACSSTWVEDPRRCLSARQELPSVSKSPVRNFWKLMKLLMSGCGSNSFLNFPWHIADRF